MRLGLEQGMTLIDTAEMYGSGAAEALVGEVIAGRRHEVFLVTKVLPQHATVRGTIVACEGSLRRLNTDSIDLYLLHWRGSVPLDETLEAFVALAESGKIRFWGVSNFDLPDMEELVSLPGGDDVATDQVLYNLARVHSPQLTSPCEPWTLSFVGFHCVSVLPEHSRKEMRDTDGKRIKSSIVRISGRSTRPWIINLC